MGTTVRTLRLLFILLSIFAFSLSLFSLFSSLCLSLYLFSSSLFLSSLSVHLSFLFRFFEFEFGIAFCTRTAPWPPNTSDDDEDDDGSASGRILCSISEMTETIAAPSQTVATFRCQGSSRAPGRRSRSAPHPDQALCRIAIFLLILLLAEFAPKLDRKDRPDSPRDTLQFAFRISPHRYLARFLPLRLAPCSDDLLPRCLTARA